MTTIDEKKQYDHNLEVHGCGYWSVCLEHDCPCHPTARVNQGFSIDTWRSLKSHMESTIDGYYSGGYIDDIWPEDEDDFPEDDPDWD